MNCKIDIPYPTIKVEKENSYYADLLYDAYSGMISELTAVNLYSYQHFNISKKYELFAKTIIDIAEVEMHHLEILGKLIKMLGSNPIYVNSKNKFWKADYVIYDNDIIDMLNTDIVAEMEAIKNYKELMNKIDDKYINHIIKRIVLDEEKHLECFNKLKMKYE